MYNLIAFFSVPRYARSRAHRSEYILTWMKTQSRKPHTEIGCRDHQTRTSVGIPQAYPVTALGRQGLTGPQGPAGSAGITTAATIVQNFTGTVDLPCPSGYVAVVASCASNIVINGQFPSPPGGTWTNYLIPDANSATGVHCNLGFGISGQANLRCAK